MPSHCHRKIQNDTRMRPAADLGKYSSHSGVKDLYSKRRSEMRADCERLDRRYGYFFIPFLSACTLPLDPTSRRRDCRTPSRSRWMPWRGSRPFDGEPQCGHDPFCRHATCLCRGHGRFRYIQPGLSAGISHGRPGGSRNGGRVVRQRISATGCRRSAELQHHTRRVRAHSPATKALPDVLSYRLRR